MHNSLIVVGVDGSPHSETAVEWAATRARETGARLRLTHAHDLPVPIPTISLAAPASPSTADPAADAARAGEAVLATAVAVAHRHGRDIEVTTDLRVGGAAPALIDASEQCDLIVVGSRGRGGFTGMLLGSVSVQVSAHADCPTIVVRDQPPDAGAVVVGVDDSEAAHTALAFAFTEAARLGTTVIAVHAWSLPLPTGPGEAAAAALADDHTRLRYQDAAQQVLTDALAGCRRQHPTVPVDERLITGSPVGALLEAATAPALIVVGSRGRGSFTGPLLGSTSQSVLRHAPCPVAVIRARQAVSPNPHHADTRAPQRPTGA
ncbi:universal stress protein [Jidongwangia harbinensis]|uniref:universal stress protein n=1 Tax=Jidongwangia harbinensis TaxID=2878561 RepID=UPI001CD9FF52|nr:universal stress protein [Jidongwangia harbinensis]MCA2219021.1 universal stress protein [Jidongwangia harbinensis]